MSDKADENKFEFSDIMDSMDNPQSKKETKEPLPEPSKLLKLARKSDRSPQKVMFAPEPPEDFDHWRFKINYFTREIITENRHNKQSPAKTFSWGKISALSNDTNCKKLYEYFELDNGAQKKLTIALYQLEIFLQEERDRIFPNNEWLKEGLTSSTTTPNDQNGYSIDEILELQDWEDEGGNVVNYCNVEKLDHEGRKVIYTIRFYIDRDTGLKISETVKPRYSEKTAPSIECMKWFERSTIEQLKEFDFVEAYDSMKQKIYDRIYHDDERIYDVFTCYIISTYFRECFNHFGFLDFCAPDPDFGKSTACRCVVLNSFNGLFAFSPSEAYIYRVLNLTKGVFGLDELDKFAFGKENTNMLGLILNAHTRGAGTGRINIETGELMPERYDTFGAKLFTRLRYINTQLITRSITINMVKNEKPDGTPIRKLSDDLEETAYTYERDMFYLFRMLYHDQVLETRKIVGEELYKDLSNRMRDIYLPLLTIARVLGLDDVYQTIYKFALEQKKKQMSRRTISDITTILIVLLENNLFGKIEVARITALMNEKLADMGDLKRSTKGEIIKAKTTAKVGRDLTSLQFERKRDSAGVSYIISLERIKAVASIYLRDLVDENDVLCRKYPDIFAEITTKQEGSVSNESSLHNTYTKNNENVSKKNTLHSSYTKKDEKNNPTQTPLSEKKDGEGIAYNIRCKSVSNVSTLGGMGDIYIFPDFKGSKEEFFDKLILHLEEKTKNKLITITDLLEQGSPHITQEWLDFRLPQLQEIGLVIFSDDKLSIRRVS